MKLLKNLSEWMKDEPLGFFLGMVQLFIVLIPIILKNLFFIMILLAFVLIAYVITTNEEN